MAKIGINRDTAVWRAAKFAGLNESGEGGRMGSGEAARCENLRVRGGRLQKRPGSRNAVVLSQSFRPVVTENEGSLSSWGYPSRTLELYPRVEAEDYDTLALAGEMTPADFAQSASKTGWYFDTAQNAVTGARATVPVSALRETREVPRSLLETKEARYAGPSRASWSGSMADYVWLWLILYDELVWNGTGYEGVNPRVVNCGEFDLFDGTKYTLLDADDRPVTFFRTASAAPSEAEFTAAAAQRGHIGRIRLNRSHANYISVTDSPLWSVWYRVEVWAEAEYRWLFNTVGVEPASADDTAVKALWTGIVGGSGVLAAACNGALWSLAPVGDGPRLSRTFIGTLSTAGRVELFGFDNRLYALTGTEYKVWDGGALTPVTAYPPYVPPAQGEEPAAPDLVTDGSAARMLCAEIYSGARGARVFLAGDGTNRVIYSGFDERGRARADCFPAGNELFVGDANTPVTALIRHYDRLLCFKTDSAWVISPDGNGFAVSPMNRETGCAAAGQARLVGNHPRTVCEGAVMEWTSAALTGSYRNAKSISERVKNTLSTFDAGGVTTYFDRQGGEYYVVSPDMRALVHDEEADAWYLYTGFDARCLINYRGALLAGTSDGHVRVLSALFRDDEGASIPCRYESAAADLGSSRLLKRLLGAWVTLDGGGSVEVSVLTDSGETRRVRVRGGTGAMPRTRRVTLKTPGASHFRLCFTSDSAEETFTVLAAELRAVKGGSAV